MQAWGGRLISGGGELKASTQRQHHLAFTRSSRFLQLSACVATESGGLRHQIEPLSLQQYCIRVQPVRRALGSFRDEWSPGEDMKAYLERSLSCAQQRRFRCRGKRARQLVVSRVSSSETTPTGRLGAAIRATESARSDALFLDALAPFLAQEVCVPCNSRASWPELAHLFISRHRQAMLRCARV